MSDRDKYGNYVNDKGVTIKINTDKNGKDHISFYDGPVDGDHSAVHVNVDYDDGGSWTSKTHGSEHSDSDPGSGGCFLTSACMNAMSESFDDNCHELQILRWFRDNHVDKEDIEYYYKVAPSIVNHINAQDDCRDIYVDIYNTVIKPCVEAIEAGKYESAYDTYRGAVKKLEADYLK